MRSKTLLYMRSSRIALFVVSLLFIVAALTSVSSAATNDLGLTMMGTGTGIVTFSPGYNCSGTCRQEYDSSVSAVTLSAAPTSDSTFNGWTGCDVVDGTNCAVSMTGARSVSVNFARLSSGTGAISGYVTDDSGAGVANATVILFHKDSGLSCSPCIAATTDASGHYSKGYIVPGPYIVVFTNQPVPFGSSGLMVSTLNQFYDNKHNPASADLVTISEGPETILNTAVYPQFGQISGLVTDIYGAGMANVMVRVFDLDDQYIAQGATGADGSYTVQHVPSGTYKLRFIANTASPILPPQNLVRQNYYVPVTAPDTVTGINATLRAGGAITGKVINKYGDPVAATVTVIGPNKISVSTASTDKTTGVYKAMGIPAGDYYVLFRASPTSLGNVIDVTQLYSRRFYGGGADFYHASTVTVAAGSVVSDIDGVLEASGPAIVPSAQSAIVSAFQTDFGVEVVGVPSYRSFTITNNGTADLVLGALSETGEDFSIMNDRCSGRTFAPLKSCTFQAMFFPMTEGDKSGVVSIPSNDPDIPLQNIYLSGIGSAAVGTPGTQSILTSTDPVTVSPPGTGITLTFTGITCSDECSVKVAPMTSFASPSNFMTLNGLSYYIVTDAALAPDGNVNVCINYDPATMWNPANEPNLRLFHFNGTTWEDITTLPVDTTAHRICGLTASLSPFAVAEPAEINTPPTANAGMNQTVHAGSPVTLDGSGSFDTSGYLPLTYAWSFVSKPAGSTTALSNPAVVDPTFTADLSGNYVVQLVVTNTLGVASQPAIVTISTTNTPPVASAGPDQAVTLIGTTVQLDGSQSYDPDGDLITYQWSFVSIPAGSAATLSDPTIVNPAFVADIHGTYVVQLVVSDPWTQSAPSTVTVSFANVKPVASAGSSQSAIVSDTVTLNGSGSYDANGDPLTYLWSFTSLPAGSLATIASPTSMLTTFVPDLPGLYVVQLIVEDGHVSSDPSTVQVQAVTTQTVAVQTIKNVQAAITSLDASAFKNASMQNALLNKLNAVIENIVTGDYAAALDKLQNDILGKTNGCAAAGVPDKNDWIRTCEEQSQVYPDVLNLIQIVQGMK